jgi:hypothetical protein
MPLAGLNIYDFTVAKASDISILINTVGLGSQDKWFGDLPFVSTMMNLQVVRRKFLIS